MSSVEPPAADKESVRLEVSLAEGDKGTDDHLDDGDFKGDDGGEHNLEDGDGGEGGPLDGGDDGGLLADDNGGLLICGDDGNLPPQGEPHGGPIRSDCGGLGSGGLTVIRVSSMMARINGVTVWE